MLKCPFCHYENQEGTLYCEQCKSDLTTIESVEPVPVEAIPVGVPSEPQPEMPPIPVAEAPVSEATYAQAAPEMAMPLEPVAADAMEADLAPLGGAAPAPADSPVEAEKLPVGSQPRLVVQRGLKINTEYPLYEGHNFIGRADEKPVDIDLDDQEPPDRVWSSRQHAVITFEDGNLVIEDLNSSNGTFVNRSRIHPGQKLPLKINDVIQIGTVQMKVKL